MQNVTYWWNYQFLAPGQTNTHTRQNLYIVATWAVNISLSTHPLYTVQFLLIFNPHWVQKRTSILFTVTWVSTVQFLVELLFWKHAKNVDLISHNTLLILTTSNTNGLNLKFLCIPIMKILKAMQNVETGSHYISRLCHDASPSVCLWRLCTVVTGCDGSQISLHSWIDGCLYYLLTMRDPGRRMGWC